MITEYRRVDVSALYPYSLRLSDMFDLGVHMLNQPENAKDTPEQNHPKPQPPHFTASVHMHVLVLVLVLLSAFTVINRHQYCNKSSDVASASEC